MQMNPYLSYSGNCEAAFKRYAEVLGGKIIAMITYADTPMAGDMPAEFKKKIVHARLDLGAQILMGADSPPGHFEASKGYSLSLSFDKVADVERVFKALSEGGQVRMPLEKTFFAASFGMLTDKFGIPWMVICEQAK